MNTVRVALTETRNAFGDMPSRVEDLGKLAGRLDEIRDSNLEHHERLIAVAAGQGARLIGLGELFPAPYFALSKEPMWLEFAEDASTGPTIARMRDAAARHGVAIVAPIYELAAPGGDRFNTAVVIGSQGDVIGKYRKAHIPHGRNESGEFLEGSYYRGSDADLGNEDPRVSNDPLFPVFDLGVVRLGVSICYDRHFEGVTRRLKAGGAQLVLSPAVTFGEKSRRMWPLEFATDACRHRVYIGGSNRRGAEPPWNQDFFGESAFFGPDGPVTCDRGHEHLVIADLDLAALDRPDPAGWDLAGNTRPDV